MKKLSSIILLLALLLTCTACGGDTDSGTPDADISSESGDAARDTTAAEPESTALKDNLPDGLDFSGKKVTFLYRSELLEEFYTEEATGDIVEDAIYQSILSVEERLGAEIVCNAQPGHMLAARAPYKQYIINSVMADDDSFDWADVMIANAGQYMQDGYCMNLLGHKYLDFEMPWYASGLEDSMALYGKLCFLTGSVSLGSLKNTYCIYFNPQTAENYGIGDLYAIVDAGDWTLDKVMEISEKASQDVNGDGKWDGEDKLGFLSHNYNHLYGFIGSCDIRMFEKDADGIYRYVFGSERDVSVCEKLYKLFHGTPGAFDCNLSDTTESEVPAFNALTGSFIEGNILMMTAQLDEAVAYLRDMDDPYGLLPFPKYDDKQEDYITISRCAHNSFILAATCNDPDMAGAVMEALSASNYDKVFPAYFETAMKVKYARDLDSARMLDLLRSSTVMNFEYIYNYSIGNPTIDLFLRYIRTENPSSLIEASRDKITATTEKYFSIIEALEI